MYTPFVGFHGDEGEGEPDRGTYGRRRVSLNERERERGREREGERERGREGGRETFTLATED